MSFIATACSEVCKLMVLLVSCEARASEKAALCAWCTCLGFDIVGSLRDDAKHVKWTA